MNKKQLFGILSFFWIIASCESNKNENKNVQRDLPVTAGFNPIDSTGVQKLETINLKRKLVKLGHAINTQANEYHPIISMDGTQIYFSGMDRSGYFDFKLDFNKQASAGGEDIFVSNLINGIWCDARPITALNTNGHEVITQVHPDGFYLTCANYPEKLGPKDANNGTETTDLFQVFKKKNGYQIIHFPEPINSIYSEFDGIMGRDHTFLIFTSDRPRNHVPYHKKGWKWNDHLWGNTDVYVSLKNGDSWSEPIPLGGKINSNGAERTPWLSKDGLTLYVSSNGYEKGRNDLNIYAFTRKEPNNWNDWEGPKIISDANSDHDDWCYSEDKNGIAYFSRSVALGYKRTQPAAGGDAGFRESNFRTGYEIHGQQSGSCLSINQSDIFSLKKKSIPDFVFEDVFFESNSSIINQALKKELVYLLDYLKINESKVIKVTGYTDQIGASSYNLKLSTDRANAVKSFLVKNGFKGEIIVEAFGEEKPIADNSTSSGRKKNRRVEIKFD